VEQYKEMCADTVGDLVGKGDRKARKPRIKHEMINKMDEQKSRRMSTTKNEGKTTED
jgi:hypothetical protein